MHIGHQCTWDIAQKAALKNSTGACRFTLTVHLSLSQAITDTCELNCWVSVRRWQSPEGIRTSSVEGG